MYSNSVVTIYKRKHIRKLEKIQGAETKLSPSLIGLSFEEGQQILNLTILQQRREKGNLITVYRGMKGLEKLDTEDLLIWDINDTRGHGMELRKHTCRRDIIKLSFPQRYAEVQIGLDKKIVNARTIISSKKGWIFIDKETKRNEHSSFSKCYN